jgi:hypothetical protein
MYILFILSKSFLYALCVLCGSNILSALCEAAVVTDSTSTLMLNCTAAIGTGANHHCHLTLLSVPSTIAFDQAEVFDSLCYRIGA